MQIFKKSEDDVHGLVRYSFGVTIGVICFTCVAGANMLSTVAQNGNAPVFAFLQPKLDPAKGIPRRPQEIDYGTTASISNNGIDNYLAHPIVLDPCTGRQK